MWTMINKENSVAYENANLEALILCHSIGSICLLNLTKIKKSS